MQSGWAETHDVQWAMQHVSWSCGSGRYIFACNCGVGRDGLFINSGLPQCNTVGITDSVVNATSDCIFNASNSPYVYADRTWSNTSGCNGFAECDKIFLICKSASSERVDACDICGCNDKTDAEGDDGWFEFGSSALVKSEIGEQGYGVCRIVDPGYGNPAVTFGCPSGSYRTDGTGSHIKCAKCPAITETELSGAWRTSDVGNTTGITGCYIPANTTFTGGDGKYQLTTKCKYSN